MSSCGVFIFINNNLIHLKFLEISNKELNIIKLGKGPIGKENM